MIADFVREYAAGRTPIPCVHCNGDLKFASLVERAEGFDAEAVATGHLRAGRVRRDDAALPAEARRRPRRRISRTSSSRCRRRSSRARASRSAHLDKAAVREEAHRLGLRVADKKDSQEICFVAAGEHPEFVGTRARRCPAARSATATGRRSAATRASTASRSASARGSASRPAFRSTWSTSTPRRRRSRLARARISSATSLTASRVNWIERRRAAGSRSARTRASATATRRRRRRSRRLTAIASASPSTSRRAQSRPARPSCSTTGE